MSAATPAWRAVTISASKARKHARHWVNGPDRHWVAYAGRFGDATYAPFVEDQEQPTLWRPLPSPSAAPPKPTTSETGNA